MGGYNIADFDAWFRKYLLTPMCVQGPLLNVRKGSVKEGVSLLFWSSLSFVHEKWAFFQHVMGKRGDLCQIDRADVESPMS